MVPHPHPIGLNHLFQLPHQVPSQDHARALSKGWSQSLAGLDFKGSTATAIGSQSRMEALPLTLDLSHPAWPAYFSSKEKNKVSWTEFQAQEEAGDRSPQAGGEPKRQPHPTPSSPQGSGGDAPPTAIPPRPKQTGKWEKCFLSRRLDPQLLESCTEGNKC